MQGAVFWISRILQATCTHDATLLQESRLAIGFPSCRGYAYECLQSFLNGLEDGTAHHVLHYFVTTCMFQRVMDLRFQHLFPSLEA